MDCRSEIGKPVILLVCGTLVYYHCAYKDKSLLTLFSDVIIVLLCSLAILGFLFRQINISVPVDPLEWQISQDTANTVVACLANTVGAAESVLRVAATGHDKRLFLKLLDEWFLVLQLLMLVYVCSVFTCWLRTLSQSACLCLGSEEEVTVLVQRML
ncbi:hypothetical protein CsatB_022775 [Cannabis sativa]